MHFDDHGPATRVLVADSNPRVRAGLRAFIEAQADLEFVGDANSESWLLWALRVAQPDVVLLDLALAGRPPSGMLQAARECSPRTRIVIMSARPWEESGALQAGAHDFVSKCQPPERVFAALRPNRQIAA